MLFRSCATKQPGTTTLPAPASRDKRVISPRMTSGTMNSLGGSDKSSANAILTGWPAATVTDRRNRSPLGRLATTAYLPGGTLTVCSRQPEARANSIGSPVSGKTATLSGPSESEPALLIVKRRSEERRVGKGRKDGRARDREK